MNLEILRMVPNGSEGHPRGKQLARGVAEREEEGSIGDAMNQVAERDLTKCPEELRALDLNADRLWLQFLRRTGVSMDVRRKRVIDNDSKRAWTIWNFGVPSLVQRLGHAKTELQRARVWWRESVACGAGDSIPDLSSENMHLLNPFIVTKSLKFKNAGFKELANRKAEQETIEQVQIARGGRYCSNQTGGKHIMPSDVRANALYCDQACKKAAYRGRAAD